MRNIVFFPPHDCQDFVCEPNRVGVGGQRIDMSSFCEEKTGKHVRFLGKIGDGGSSGGGGVGRDKGTSKAGAGSRSGGSGEEYNEQVGGQVGRMEEIHRKGWKGADSSEDV